MIILERLEAAMIGMYFVGILVDSSSESGSSSLVVSASYLISSVWRISSTCFSADKSGEIIPDLESQFDLSW